MTSIRRKLVNAAIRKAFSLVDHADIDKRFELRQETILADESLTNDEKSEAIKELIDIYDENKVTLNLGMKRVCGKCKLECLAKSYCEYCVRNYLRTNFSNWTSGNKEVDNLIKNCQMKSKVPYKIIEWIPYKNLQNIKYLTKGGFSEIYTADWIGGWYFRWNSDNQRLIRYGTEKVILKRLTNIESANRSWFEEVCNLKKKIKKLSICF